jgi:glucose-1-phosphate adenylyltransferase
VVTVILGGGRGTRLWPLTAVRAKPAVPLAGKFRLIDIAVSNSIHAGLDRIYVLTQFNSESLHRHIGQTYRFDAFSAGFVSILAAEQTIRSGDWYQGTADAVRQNLPHIAESESEHVVILSGDQLYLMDLERVVAEHAERGADLSVAVTPVRRDAAHAFGIMRLDDESRITEFIEKPSDPEVLDGLALQPATIAASALDTRPGMLLASMGIYVFRTEALFDLLRGHDGDDFGRELIPHAVATQRVYGHVHGGYWRDIGTIRSFHEASLELCDRLPALDLYDPERPVLTHPRFLPGSKVVDCQVKDAILNDGSIIRGSHIERSIIGIRAVVREGTRIERSVVMGATRFEDDPPSGSPPLGIGASCEIRNAIVDMDARIGEGCRLVNEAGVAEADGEGWHIRDGIIVVPKGAVLPAGTVV